MANTTADKLAKLNATKADLKDAINGSGNTVGDVFADYPAAVSNGRAGIATAITEKGVQTSADAPFDVLEANVRAIESGGGVQTTTLKIVNSISGFFPDPTVYVSVYDESSGKISRKSVTVMKGFSETVSNAVKNSLFESTLKKYSVSGGYVTDNESYFVITDDNPTITFT